MKEKTPIIIDNILLFIDRYYYESDEMFYFRIKYIIDNIIVNKKEKYNLEDIIGLSMIEMQKYFNKCNYSILY